MCGVIKHMGETAFPPSVVQVTLVTAAVVFNRHCFQGSRWELQAHPVLHGCRLQRLPVVAWCPSSATFGSERPRETGSDAAWPTPGVAGMALLAVAAARVAGAGPRARRLHHAAALFGLVGLELVPAHQRFVPALSQCAICGLAVDRVGQARQGAAPGIRSSVWKSPTCRRHAMLRRGPANKSSCRDSLQPFEGLRT